MQEAEFNMEFFADAWFKDLEKKIAVLPLLKEIEYDRRFLKDEAYTLCLVYLDWLSGGFQTCKGKGICDLEPPKNGKKHLFYRLLINYAGNSLFKKILFRQLVSDLKKGNRDNKIIFEKLKNFFQLDEELLSKNETGAYLKIYNQEELINFLEKNSILIPSEFKLLKEKLENGEGSVAFFCYEKIRCPAVHEWGAPSWSIGEIKISFEMLHSSLNNIYKYIKDDYEKTGKFFGHECEYPFSRQQV